MPRSIRSNLFRALLDLSTTGRSIDVTATEIGDWSRDDTQITDKGGSSWFASLAAARRQEHSRRAAAAVLLGVMLAHGATAAPPPVGPPAINSNIGTAQALEAIQQMRRFEAAGLPIPTPPPNGGQCVIDTGGSLAPAPGTTGPTGTYRLYEIQRWEVSAMPSSQPGQPDRV
jgi:hypothetical protein